MANGNQKGRGFLDMFQDAMKRQFPAAKAEYWFDTPANAQPPGPQDEQQIWGGEEGATTPLGGDHPQRQEQSPLGGEWQTPKAQGDLPDYLQKKLDYLKATGGLFLRDPHSPRAALERGYPLHRAFGWSTDAGTNQPGFPNQQTPEPAPDAPDKPFSWPPMSDLLDPWLKELENAAAKQPPPARRPSLRDVHRKMMLQELAGLQAKAATLGVPFDQLPPDPNAPVRSPAIAQARMRMLKELAEEQAKAASQGASLNQPVQQENTRQATPGTNVSQMNPSAVRGINQQPQRQTLGGSPQIYGGSADASTSMEPPDIRSNPSLLAPSPVTNLWNAPVVPPRPPAQTMQPPNIGRTTPAPTPPLIAGLRGALPNQPPPPPGIGGQQQQQAKQIASMRETLPPYAQSPSLLGEPLSLPMDPDQIRQQLKAQGATGARQAGQNALANSAKRQARAGGELGLPEVPGPGRTEVDKNIQATLEMIVGTAAAREPRAVALAWFLNQVRPHGEWDYKVKKDAKGSEQSGYDDFGNFNYGATGAALGISEDDLLKGAGVVKSFRSKGDRSKFKGSWFLGIPPYGNAQRAVDQIKAGIAYYRDYEAKQKEGQGQR